ncbi:protein SIX6OS1 isoform X1 [Nothobranchius furzeri]|uniref:protein SIX6OS1 isoform X1 n=1 Tax=Nothobranchius furzeri TaxID=105023 RepID=UPI00077D29C0|nr:membrane-associated guanylate kinase, WW and PDZ domain-containing protein 1 isoform X1 [Nothobranchius furzeri]
MSDEVFLTELNGLLFQLGLNNRELSQKKNEITQQIGEHSLEIDETKSHIETLQGHVKKLEEEINVKHSRILKNKENANGMKATSSLLFQYEQMTKADLESRKASYNSDLEVYEEKISSSRKTLESYKERYFKNPLAQKLLKLQGESDEIRSRIKACNDQIMAKQKEMEHLRDPAAKLSSSEKLSDSGLGQQPTAYEEQSEHQTEENETSAINDISSQHLDQTAERETYAVANFEEDREQNKVQDFPTCLNSPEDPNKELWSYQQMEEKSQADEIDSEAQNRETSKENQVLENKMAVLDVEDVLEEEMETRAPSEEEQAPTEEDHQEVFVFPQSSHQQDNPEPLTGRTASLASTPTFTFNPSPTGSPHRDTSEAKSPHFLFASTSNASTPGFPGFGFDVGSSQEEDSSFAFTGSLFSEKKASEAKPSSYPEFLFDQPDKSEDFQFAFAAKSPQPAGKENKDEFPFSFNF